MRKQWPVTSGQWLVSNVRARRQRLGWSRALLPDGMNRRSLGRDDNKGREREGFDRSDCRGARGLIRSECLEDREGYQVRTPEEQDGRSTTMAQRVIP